MKVGIVGCGVVGGTLSLWLKENTWSEVITHDPPKGQVGDIASCDIVFIAVPVPTNEDGTQDINQLHSALEVCAKDQPIYIRSTVLPGTSDLLSKTTGKRVRACPEFLTERIAKEEMGRLPIVIGEKIPHKLIAELFKSKKLICMSSRSAELAKYVHNSFGALKVNFFNHINQLCDKNYVHYGMMMEAVLATGFINKTHTQVPGPDGEFGYGGKCLPKDTKAFARWADFALLTQTVVDNEEVRK